MWFDSTGSTTTVDIQLSDIYTFIDDEASKCGVVTCSLVDYTGTACAASGSTLSAYQHTVLYDNWQFLPSYLVFDGSKITMKVDTDDGWEKYVCFICESTSPSGSVSVIIANWKFK